MVQPSSEITKLRKEVADLKKLLKQNNRSRSPWRRAVTNHDQPLAITDASNPSKGKGKGKKGKRKGGKPPVAAQTGGWKCFAEIHKKRELNKGLFIARAETKGWLKRCLLQLPNEIM